MFLKFEKFPYFARSLAAAWLGYKNAKVRYSGEYSCFFNFLLESRDFDISEQRAWQLTRLRALVNSARTGTEYYKDFSLTGADELGLVLHRLPLLSKKDLRAKPQSFFNSNFDAWISSATSGTTGSPMVVEHEKASMQRRFALLHDHLRLHGVDPFGPSVRLSGRIIADPSKAVRKPWLYVPSENQLLISTYHLNREHSEVLARKLSDFKPVLLDGYSSGVVELVRLMKDAGHSFDSLQAIITTAETLDPRVRDELQSVTGAPVLDYYAASEGVPIIQQCRYGTYHVRWESGIFEVDTGAAISFEGDGELIVTSFIQDRTPLIRYRTGDSVRGLRVSQHQRCGCGLLTPTIDAVEGRVEDVVLAKGGRKLGMFTYRTLKEIEGIGEAQVRQLDYERFKVIGVIKPGIDQVKLERQIKAKFEQVLGYEIYFEFEAVEALPRGNNGKVRLVINEIQS